MGMQYVNGELVDDSQNKDESGSALAGLSTPQAPNRTGANMSQNYMAYEDPNWMSKVNTMGLKLDPSWMKQIGQENNFAPEDWSRSIKAYNDNFSPIEPSLSWWGDQSMKRAALSGFGMLNDPRFQGFDAEKYLNRGVEGTQQKGIADAYHRAHDGQGGDWFESFLPALVLGGLGLATGGFGLGAAGAAADVGAAMSDGVMLETALGGGVEAAAPGWVSAEGGAGYMDGLAADAGELAGGPIGYEPGVEPQVVNTQTYSGDPQDYLGIESTTNTGPGGGWNNPVSTDNLQQALHTPQTTAPSPGSTLADVTQPGYNPEIETSIDQVSQAGLDSPAGIREATVNQPSFANQIRERIRDLKDIINNPKFQIAKAGVNFLTQNQKYNTLKDMYSKMEQRSDVGGPFRELYMRSLTDPNFFKSMPEFQAGLDSFNQQYGANSARAGTRSQLGGAAHQIAVNREASKLGNQWRSSIAPLAGQQPQMSGMGAMAPALASAGANRYAGLMDPALWGSVMGKDSGATDILSLLKMFS